MKIKEVKINCPISQFQKQEREIKDITYKINKAQRVHDKAKFAQELIKEVDVLLTCSVYDKENPHCENCHFIANLREKTARVIIKAEKLA